MRSIEHNKIQRQWDNKCERNNKKLFNKLKEINGNNKKHWEIYEANIMQQSVDRMFEYFLLLLFFLFMKRETI